MVMLCVHTATALSSFYQWNSIPLIDIIREHYKGAELWIWQCVAQFCGWRWIVHAEFLAFVLLQVGLMESQNKSNTKSTLFCFAYLYNCSLHTLTAGFEMCQEKPMI